MKHSRKMIALESFNVPIPNSSDMMPPILRHLLEWMAKQVPTTAIEVCQESGREAIRKLHARKLASGAGADKDRFCGQK